MNTFQINSKLFILIESTGKKHSEEISSVKLELSHKIESISEKVTQIETDVGSLRSKVQEVDRKVENTSKIAQMNKRIMNNLMQEKLSLCMDIDGLTHDQF